MYHNITIHFIYIAPLQTEFIKCYDNQGKQETVEDNIMEQTINDR